MSLVLGVAALACGGASTRPRAAEATRTVVVDRGPASRPDARSDSEAMVAGGGTKAEVFVDPYLAGLRQRIERVWVRPSGDGVAIGCVRLDATGQIVDRELVRRSSNEELDRSVELALQQVDGMDAPVPGHLVRLLTEAGICFRFTPAHGG